LLALLDLCLCSLNQQGYPCWGIDFSLSNGSQMQSSQHLG